MPKKVGAELLAQYFGVGAVSSVNSLISTSPSSPHLWLLNLSHFLLGPATEFYGEV